MVVTGWVSVLGGDSLVRLGAGMLSRPADESVIGMCGGMSGDVGSESTAIVVSALTAAVSSGLTSNTETGTTSGVGPELRSGLVASLSDESSC